VKSNLKTVEPPSRTFRNVNKSYYHRVVSYLFTEITIITSMYGVPLLIVKHVSSADTSKRYCIKIFSTLRRLRLNMFGPYFSSRISNFTFDVSSMQQREQIRNETTGDGNRNNVHCSKTLRFQRCRPITSVSIPTRN